MTDQAHREIGTHHAPRPVVVGYSEGATGDTALRAAAVEARLRQAPVTILHKFLGPQTPEVFARPTAADDERRAAIDHLLRTAHDAIPGIEHIDVRVVTGPIGGELVLASKTAALIVLGVTTNHAASAALFDTVPREVVRHAHCPVLVVPAAETGQSPSQVVCGIDRSPASINALRWATADAALRGVTVLAVEILPQHHHDAGRDGPPLTLSRWVDRHAPQVATTVICSAEVGKPAHRLIEIAAANNALLVIGGHDQHGSRWPRSVARVVTSQTRVPVVVIPEPAPHDEVAQETMPASVSRRGASWR